MTPELHRSELRRPELHREVRESYRNAMRERRTQESAFDLAIALLRDREPGLDQLEARRVVARMLAQEPPRAATS
jgi:hypothetical protein